ncbi:hypothetical protein FPV67DRAFT_617246 [Lyophyllum atratum]|nr:hypothetical protein FPV67DRAFT_617246 [Lyophyllum atratum]
MPWPPYIRNVFNVITSSGDEIEESRYYGAYNNLLGELFPPSDHFVVVIPYSDHPSYAHPNDFATPFIVRRHGYPVFFIEIRPAGHLENSARLADADEQMRKEIDDLSTELNIPTLYGVSAIGTRLCIYRYESGKGVVTPEPIEKESREADARGLASRWDVDVLTSEAETRLRDATNHVEAMCEHF